MNKKLEEFRNEYKPVGDNTLDDQLSIIKEIIKEKKKDAEWGEGYKGSYEQSCEDEGYNQALDDILKELI